jgi:hypothetical protein
LDAARFKELNSERRINHLKPFAPPAAPRRAAGANALQNTTNSALQRQQIQVRCAVSSIGNSPGASFAASQHILCLLFPLTPQPPGDFSAAAGDGRRVL